MTYNPTALQLIIVAGGFVALVVLVVLCACWAAGRYDRVAEDELAAESERLHDELLLESTRRRMGLS